MPEIAVPVPDMVVRRLSAERTGLYRIEVEDAEYLVVETPHGYFGCGLVCPHRGSRLELSGTVCSDVPAIFCQAHAIAYSLVYGTCIENHGAEHEEPGVLSTFPVRREGDVFMVRL